MSKFKVGDRVRAKDSALGQFTAGKDYTVLKLGTNYIEVERDDRGKTNGWSDRNFELAPHAGPIRTVTRREIVPGTYGDVEIYDPGSKYVRVTVDAPMEAASLRAAAKLFGELADALDENAKVPA